MRQKRTVMANAPFLSSMVDAKDARIEKLQRDNKRIANALGKLAQQIAGIEASVMAVAQK